MISMDEKRLILAYDLQMFAKDGPGGEKTEPATAKKLNEAREEGKVVKSRELSAAVDLLVLFLVLKIFMSYVAQGLIEAFGTFYTKIPDVVADNADGMTRTCSCNSDQHSAGRVEGHCKADEAGSEQI